MTQSNLHISRSVPGKAQQPSDTAPVTEFSPGTLVADPGYAILVEVFRDAHNHAARGKGLERHANDLPFEQQRMISICRLLDSPDGMAYQVMKKITEGLNLPEYHRTRSELLGALNYLAGIVIFLDEKQGYPVAPIARKPTKTWCPEDKYGDHNWSLIDPTAPGLGNRCTYCDFKVEPNPPASR